MSQEDEHSSLEGAYALRIPILAHIFSQTFSMLSYLLVDVVIDT